MTFYFKESYHFDMSVTQLIDASIKYVLNYKKIIYITTQKKKK